MGANCKILPLSFIFKNPPRVSLNREITLIYKYFLKKMLKKASNDLKNA
jgi:hypothetical protein